MKTPITDSAYARFVKEGNENKNLVGPMVMLESDRSALMEALEGISRLLDDDSWNRPTQAAWKKCRAALATARANFPDED